MNEDEAIQNIYKKIEREKVLINGANAMRAQTNNEAVRSRLDSQMRDARRNLQFFEDKLRELQMRRMNQGVSDMSLGGAGGPGQDDGQPPAPPPKDADASWGPGDVGNYGNAQYSQIGGHGDLMPPRHPYAPPGPNSGMPKSRPNFTKLGQCHCPVARSSLSGGPSS
jgi:classical protein kinase C